MTNSNYIVMDEAEFIAQDVEKYIDYDHFPYKEALTPIKNVKVSLNLLTSNGVQPKKGKCFANSLLSSNFERSYNIVFCYVKEGDKLTPHCIVEKDGDYFEVSPYNNPEGATYYLYKKFDYISYLRFVQEVLNVKPSEYYGKQGYPISLNEYGQFVFVRTQANETQPNPRI